MPAPNANQLPKTLRPIQPATAGPKIAAPAAHTVPTQKNIAYSFKDKFFATHEEAIEEKLSQFFRETHKGAIGVTEIARFIRENIDVLKKICAEQPEDRGQKSQVR